MSRKTEYPCQVCNTAPAHSLGEGVVLCTKCIRFLRKNDILSLVNFASSPMVRPPLSFMEGENLAKELIEAYASPLVKSSLEKGENAFTYYPIRSGLGWVVDDGSVRVVTWVDSGALHLSVNDTSSIFPLKDGWTLEQCLVVLERLQRRILRNDA